MFFGENTSPRCPDQDLVSCHLPNLGQLEISAIFWKKPLDNIDCCKRGDETNRRNRPRTYHHNLRSIVVQDPHWSFWVYLDVKLISLPPTNKALYWTQRHEDTLSVCHLVASNRSRFIWALEATECAWIKEEDQFLPTTLPETLLETLFQCKEKYTRRSNHSNNNIHLQAPEWTDVGTWSRPHFVCC